MTEDDIKRLQLLASALQGQRNAALDRAAVLEAEAMLAKSKAAEATKPDDQAAAGEIKRASSTGK